MTADTFGHCLSETGKYCSQWHLVDDDTLHYKHLAAWDAAMHHLEDHFCWLADPVRLNANIFCRPKVLLGPDTHNSENPLDGHCVYINLVCSLYHLVLVKHSLI